MARWPGFIGGSGTPATLVASAERAVNVFPEAVQTRSTAGQGLLIPTPGFRPWSIGAADVGGRASGVADGRLFQVIGAGFYEVDSGGNAIRRGTVVQDSYPAQIVYSGKVAGQLGIKSGNNVYAFDLTTNTFTGPHLVGQATMLAFADGFGLALDITTGVVRLSNLNDFTTWDPGTFFQREKHADPWQAMFVDANALVWLVGTETFEVWYDADPARTQPWAPLNGMVGRWGIVAPFAWAVHASGVSWLGRSGPEGGVELVTTAGASAPESVTTYAVATAFEKIRRTSTVTDAELLVYRDQGHSFINVQFPTASKTWTFDQQMKVWHERGQWSPTLGDYGIWAPRVHADCFGKHLIGDRTTGTIWEMSSAISTDIDGSGIRRLRRAPVLLTEGKREVIDQIELLMLTGVGLADGQGSDPVALLRMSDDFGQTFGNERRAQLGRIGETLRRVRWTQLGAGKGAAPVGEFVWTDPVPTYIVDAFVNNLEAVP
jgi:hypothetical protein